LDVNGEDLRDAPHERAIAALRQTPPVIKLTVFRENAETLEEDINDIIEIDLFKKSGKGLGLSIVGRKNGSGVFISEVVKGGIAESDSRLMVGDQILEVNGQDLRNATQEYAAAILKVLFLTLSSDFLLNCYQISDYYWKNPFENRSTESRFPSLEFGKPLDFQIR
jgi:hypothetical protein